MDLAITVFLVTLAVVGGILSPFILIMVITAFSNSMKALAGAAEAKVEEIKKLPPFDDVELNLNPATRILTGRIIKDEKVLWQGSVRRQENDL